MMILMIMLATCQIVTASTAGDNKSCGQSISSTKKVIIVGAVGTVVVGTAVVIGPLILPASTVATTAVVAAKITAAGSSIKTAISAALPVVKKANILVTVTKTSFFAFRQAKESFYPTEEQMVSRFLKEKAAQCPFEEQLRKNFNK